MAHTDLHVRDSISANDFFLKIGLFISEGVWHTVKHDSSYNWDLQKIAISWLSLLWNFHRSGSISNYATIARYFTICDENGTGCQIVKIICLNKSQNLFFFYKLSFITKNVIATMQNLCFDSFVKRDETFFEHETVTAKKPWPSEKMLVNMNQCESE